MIENAVVLRKEASENPFAVAAPDQSAPMVVANTRAAQEVQAMMVIAKKYPRNEQLAYSKIMTACKRKALAEEASYEYPRGKEKITGPSIRLAEVLAQSWGNIDSGIVELERRDGESDMMAFAWDLETNTRSTKIFMVRHERETKRGNTRLTGERDIYEAVANYGARRLRACILSVIPGDVVDAAVAECEKTLVEGSSEPLVDRLRKMVEAFAGIQVSVAMLEAFLGHKLEATSEQKFAKLRRIYKSIKDGMAGREDWFDVNADQPKASFGDEVPMGDGAATAASGATTAEAPKTPKVDLRAEFLAAVDSAKLPHDKVLEFLKTQEPGARPYNDLKLAIQQIHGKPLKAYTQDIASGKLTQVIMGGTTVASIPTTPPGDPLGAESPEIIDLKKRLDEGQLTVNQFLQWGVQANVFEEVTDLREIPTDALKSILAFWKNAVSQIATMPK